MVPIRAPGPRVALARVLDGDGDWWADLTVSNQTGSGEIKVKDTLLLNGSYCRMIGGVLDG